MEPSEVLRLFEEERNVAYAVPPLQAHSSHSQLSFAEGGSS